jgi:hypothetical protein
MPLSKHSLKIVSSEVGQSFFRASQFAEGTVDTAAFQIERRRMTKNLKNNFFEQRSPHFPFPKMTPTIDPSKLTPGGTVFRTSPNSGGAAACGGLWSGAGGDCAGEICFGPDIHRIFAKTFVERGCESAHKHFVNLNKLLNFETAL